MIPSFIVFPTQFVFEIGPFERVSAESFFEVAFHDYSFSEQSWWCFSGLDLGTPDLMHISRLCLHVQLVISPERTGHSTREQGVTC